MEVAAFADFSPILNAAKVDFIFVGHVHYYNRYLPYDSVTKETDKASVSADGATYTNPMYTVVVVTGASGDREDDSVCKPADTVAPSYTCSENYGYGSYTAVNSTLATWSFKTVKADGKGPADFADAFRIVRS